jgi:hypothetical protein
MTAATTMSTTRHRQTIFGRGRERTVDGADMTCLSDRVRHGFRDGL